MKSPAGANLATGCGTWPRSFPELCMREFASPRRSTWQTRQRMPPLCTKIAAYGACAGGCGTSARTAKAATPPPSRAYCSRNSRGASPVVPGRLGGRGLKSLSLCRSTAFRAGWSLPRACPLDDMATIAPGLAKARAVHFFRMIEQQQAVEIGKHRPRGCFVLGLDIALCRVGLRRVRPDNHAKIPHRSLSAGFTSSLPMEEE
jgi:hypothetical protein